MSEEQPLIVDEQGPVSWLTLNRPDRLNALSIKVLDIVRGSTGTTLVRFLRIEGDVKVKQAGEFSWESANPKMLLRVGDQVKTSSTASAQLLYFDGSKTTIQPGSLLEIRDLYEDAETLAGDVFKLFYYGALSADHRADGLGETGVDPMAEDIA